MLFKETALKNVHHWHPEFFHDECTYKFFFKQRIDRMMKIQKSFGKDKPLLPEQWNLNDAKNDAKNFKYQCKGIMSLCTLLQFCINIIYM